MFTPRVSTPTSSAPNSFGQLRRENSTIDPEECPGGDFLQPEDHYLEIGYWMKSFERNKLNGVCKFCHSIAKGNITRMKGHFTGEGSVSRLCPLVVVCCFLCCCFLRYYFCLPKIKS